MNGTRLETDLVLTPRTQSGNIFMEVHYELPASFVRIWVVFGLKKNPDEVYK